MESQPTIQDVLKTIYTPEREAEMEANRQDWNAALAAGDEARIDAVRAKIMKQINQQQQEMLEFQRQARLPKP